MIAFMYSYVHYVCMIEYKYGDDDVNDQ